MIDLEVVRFLLIDDFNKQNHTPKIIQRIKNSLPQAFPFCIDMVLFLVWRLTIFKSARSATDVDLVASYHHAHSIHMLLHLVLEVLKDTVETLLGAWAVPLYQLAVTLDYYSLLTALLVGCAGTGIYVAFYKRFYKQDGLSTPDSQASPVFLFLFGVILSVVTLLPIILAYTFLISLITTLCRQQSACSLLQGDWWKSFEAIF